MFLPLLMDIETDGCSKKTENNMNIYDYIYLKEGNELLKYKVNFNHMSVTNSIGLYIDTFNIHDFDLQSEDYLRNTKFFPYIGNFKLEGSNKKTNNYLVPGPTPLLGILFEKYEDTIVNINILNNLFRISKIYYSGEKYDKLNCIKKLFKDINIELVDRYLIGQKGIEETINLLKNKDNKELLEQLKLIL